MAVKRARVRDSRSLVVEVGERYGCMVDVVVGGEALKAMDWESLILPSSRFYTRMAVICISKHDSDRCLEACSVDCQK